MSPSDPPRMSDRRDVGPLSAMLRSAQQNAPTERSKRRMWTALATTASAASAAATSAAHAAADSSAGASAAAKVAAVHGGVAASLAAKSGVLVGLAVLVGGGALVVGLAVRSPGSLQKAHSAASVGGAASPSGTGSAPESVQQAQPADPVSSSSAWPEAPPALSAGSDLPGAHSALARRRPAGVPAPGSLSQSSPSSGGASAVREGALLLRARRVLDTHPALALELVQQHAREFPDSQLAPERQQLMTAARAKLAGRGQEKASPKDLTQ